MSSLIKDFQRDLIQSSKSTTELLRTAKLISAKLGLSDITEWLNAELGGYDDPTKIPDYRLVRQGELLVRNPVRGWMPSGSVDLRIKNSQPMTQLEALLGPKPIVIPLAPRERFAVRDQLGSSMMHWEQQIQISEVQLKGLINAVRDKLLDWSLELEKRGILGDNMSFDENERKSAHSQTFHIQNFTGVFGNVSNSSVQIYDYSSLHQTLKQQNVPQLERNQLENIMDDLKTAEPAKKASLLEKAKAWVVKNEEFLGSSAAIVRKALGLGDGGSQ